MEGGFWRLASSSALLIFGGISVAKAQCEASTHALTFSEFRVGTTISSNYSSEGVLFSSGGGYPFITTDGANPSSPVLSGTPRFSGPITAAFVSPTDSSATAATHALTFQAGYFDQTGSTTISFYDINVALLGTVTNSSLGIQTFTAPVGTASFTITTADDAGYAIDNLSYTIGPSSSLRISQPQMGATFALTQNNLTRSGNIAFAASGEAATGQVSWNVTMEYDTDVPRGLPSLATKFHTSGTGSKNIYYQSRGGRGRVTATSGGNQNPTEACPLGYFYVVGTQIPEDQVTARLVSLYPRGATPRLFTGIAFRESSYNQFRQRAKYDLNALWPNESMEDGGSHVGLMQVAVSATAAWDWLENTKSAADLFQEKLRIAASRERRERQRNRGLRALTDLELENWAILLYGPYPRFGPYYVVEQQPGGGVDWAVNPDNPSGVNYVASIRANIR